MANSSFFFFPRLLHVQNGYCKFEEAERTYNQAMQLVKRLQQAGVSPNLSSLYSEFSTLYMLRSNYAEVSTFTEKLLFFFLSFSMIVLFFIYFFFKWLLKVTVLVSLWDSAFTLWHLKLITKNPWIIYWARKSVLRTTSHSEMIYQGYIAMISAQKFCNGII